MPFRETYTEILNMIRKALLDVRMCRAILRRAGYWPISPGGSGGPDIRGTFSEITIYAGYSGEYLEGETSYNFPDGSESMAVSADFTGYTHARLVVVVSSTGGTGSTLSVAFDEGSFVDAVPSVAMDDPNYPDIHVTDWCAFNPIGVDTLRWILTNPSGFGRFTVGLCQLQVR